MKTKLRKKNQAAVSLRVSMEFTDAELIGEDSADKLLAALLAQGKLRLQVNGYAWPVKLRVKSCAG